MENILVRNSHSKVLLEDRPDICIINTCGVTSKSDYQSRQLIRRAFKSGATVFVTGCYAELNQEEIRSMNQDIILINNNDKVLYFNKFKNKGLSKTLSSTSSRSRAMVKIQDGCNANCTYCIIPQARGGSKSREIEDIVDEIRNLELAGYNEVVLTGIHIGFYGQDLTPRVMLSDLVESVLKTTKRIRVRMSSTEVNEITDKIVDLMKEDRVCNHLHLPLQSGDDDILRKMNRPYMSMDYETTIFRLHKTIPNISLGADVIAGFPGEKDAHFENTYRFISNIPLTYLHVFPYSKRKKTRAFYLPDHIDWKTKKERAAMLRKLSEKKKKAFLENQIGRTLPVIVEKHDGSVYHGTTENYLKIIFYSAPVREKSIINLIVTGRQNSHLMGKPLLNP